MRNYLWRCIKTDKLLAVQPIDKVKQVVATMAVEDMYFSKEFIYKMQKVAEGELSSEQVRQEVINKYGR